MEAATIELGQVSMNKLSNPKTHWDRMRERKASTWSFGEDLQGNRGLELGLKEWYNLEEHEGGGCSGRVVI